MAFTAMVSIEGVLAQDSVSLIKAAPVPIGIALYHSLKTMFKLALVTSAPTKEVDHWLRVAGLSDHAYLLTPGPLDDPTDITALRTRQLRTLRNNGADVGLVIDSSPAVAAMALSKGVSGVVFTHPSYTRPEFRPDYEEKRKPWAEIEREITIQRQLKATDLRFDAEMVGDRYDSE